MALDNTTVEQDKLINKVEAIGNVTDELLDVARYLDEMVNRYKVALEVANIRLRTHGHEEVEL